MMIKTLHNEKGAILLITLCFVLEFTSLGIASIYHVTRQNELTQLLRASTEAFWLADGGVQKALAKVPGKFDPAASANLGRGQYNVFSDNPTGDAFDLKWFVEAKGMVNNQIR